MKNARQPHQTSTVDDVARLEEWMNLYGQDVIHLAYSYVHNYHKAEDLAQDAFLRAWRNFGSYQGQSSIKTWILAIAANRCKDYLRSWSAKHEWSDDGTVLQNVPTRDASEEIAERLERDRLWEIVFRLPEKYREVVVLFYAKEMSGSEVAEVLGISEQSVRTRLHRARQLLKDVLSEAGVGFDV